ADGDLRWHHADEHDGHHDEENRLGHGRSQPRGHDPEGERSSNGPERPTHLAPGSGVEWGGAAEFSTLAPRIELEDAEHLERLHLRSLGLEQNATALVHQ